MSLKTDYKDDIPKTTQRKYEMINNDDGTVSLKDVTEYTQVGDTFGAGDINKTNKAINDLLGGTTYATVEQLTSDRWINGKPIYTSTITVGRLSNGGSVLINLASLRIDLCMFDTGNSAVLMSDGVYVPIQQGTTTNTNTGTYLTEVRYLPSSSSLAFACGSNRALTRADITIRYTKR